MFHDWPESYFKAQQSRGAGLAGVFQQALGAARAQKVTRQKNVLARMFPGARLVSLLGAQVCYITQNVSAVPACSLHLPQGMQNVLCT